MTTRYPEAQWRPLETTQRQPRMQRHDVICLHTMVGSLTGTDAMFKKNGWGGTESHFGIGGPWSDGLDGIVYQWQDTDFTADANLNGNRRLISIETADNAPRLAKDIKPWSDRQLDAIVALIAYLCETYDIPAELIPDSGPGRRGIGYHRLGIQHGGGTHPTGWLQSGCEVWSLAEGKECPGDARVAQVPGIITRVKAVLAGKPIKQEVPDMQWTDQIKLTEWDAEAWGTEVGKEVTIGAMLRNPTSVRYLRREVAAQKVQLDTLARAVQALADNSPDAVREAFAAGVVQLRAELDQIDIRVTTGPDDTP